MRLKVLKVDGFLSILVTSTPLSDEKHKEWKIFFSSCYSSISLNNQHVLKLFSPRMLPINLNQQMETIPLGLGTKFSLSL